MKKLTATQMKVYKSLTEQCDKARAAGSAREWYNTKYINPRNLDPYGNLTEEVRQAVDHNWREACAGRGLITHDVNSRTLRALESAGLIVAHIGAGWIDSSDLVNY